MNQYFFILGREPQLSVTEIWQLLGSQNIKAEPVVLTKTFLIVTVNQPLDLAFLQRQLGGTIKSGEIFLVTNNSESEIQTAITKKLAFNSGRLYFGFSWYGSSPSWFKNLGLKLKRELKELGRVRYVVSREAILSSVTVQKNHLLPPDGFEIIFLPHNNFIYLGQTITVQPFADFSERDYGRPGRDARMGMLPPKLARLMVNLAGGPAITKLLDPFCGTGTVIQEAALSGIKHLVGSDVNTNQIKLAETNWHWLKSKNFQIDVDVVWFNSPLEKLSGLLTGDKFDAIVCEPDLGPPLTGREPDTKIVAIAEDLKIKYQTWLRIIGQLLLPNGKVVMVWPAFVVGKQISTLTLDEAVTKASLRFGNIVPPFVPTDWLSERGTLMYYRPGQKVAREIVVLTR